MDLREKGGEEDVQKLSVRPRHPFLAHRRKLKKTKVQASAEILTPRHWDIENPLRHLYAEGPDAWEKGRNWSASGEG